MKTLKETVPTFKNNQGLTILEKIQLDENTEFIGWKIDTFKEVKNDEDDDTHYEIDKSIPTIYDDTTKEIIEKQKNKDNIESLQSMLSQSIAHHAKTNSEIDELKQMNANLMQSIAKLQIKEEN